MALVPGTRLGPYEIVELRGKGGMGEVYRAKDTRLDRSVAIKVLPAELSEDETYRKRLEREAKTISQLQHPNVCMLLDIGSEGATQYLVMEFLEGETLEDRLRKGALPIDDVLRIGVEIAEAVEAAHRAGVVHRDLKPAKRRLTSSFIGSPSWSSWFPCSDSWTLFIPGARRSLPRRPPHGRARGVGLGSCLQISRRGAR